MLRSSEIKPLFVDLSHCDKSFFYKVSLGGVLSGTVLIFFKVSPGGVP